MAAQPYRTSSQWISLIRRHLLRYASATPLHSFYSAHLCLLREKRQPISTPATVSAACREKLLKGECFSHFSLFTTSFRCLTPRPSFQSRQPCPTSQTQHPLTNLKRCHASLEIERPVAFNGLVQSIRTGSQEGDAKTL